MAVIQRVPGHWQKQPMDGSKLKQYHENSSMVGYEVEAKLIFKEYNNLFEF